MIDNQIAPFVESMLNYSARRQQALTANIANIDTPGYRASDVAFQQELASSIQLAATNPRHIGPPAGASSSTAYEEDTVEKANGNTVSLEREMTELTKNGLQYVTLIQYMTSKVKTLRSSMNEGGRV